MWAMKKIQSDVFMSAESSFGARSNTQHFCFCSHDQFCATISAVYPNWTGKRERKHKMQIDRRASRALCSLTLTSVFYLLPCYLSMRNRPENSRRPPPSHALHPTCVAPVRKTLTSFALLTEAQTLSDALPRVTLGQREQIERGRERGMGGFRGLPPTSVCLTLKQSKRKINHSVIF